MHIGTMVEFAFALVGKLDVINKHSFNDFKLRVGEWKHRTTIIGVWASNAYEEYTGMQWPCLCLKCCNMSL